MSIANISRFHWNARVINRLRATTRPLGEIVMTPAEVDEALRCYAMEWDADAYAQILIDRDMHLRLVG